MLENGSETRLERTDVGKKAAKAGSGTGKKNEILEDHKLFPDSRWPRKEQNRGEEETGKKKLLVSCEVEKGSRGESRRTRTTKTVLRRGGGKTQKNSTR